MNFIVGKSVVSEGKLRTLSLQNLFRQRVKVVSKSASKAVSEK